MDTRRGTRWLAVAAALVTYALLTVGGVVTSRGAGMVFRDWPLSEGSVNPEGWTRDADKASEHGHRLLGVLAGVFTVALAVALQRTDPRRSVRRLGWIAVVAVCVQGLLGGLRVTEISGELALLHGCTGQAFFCLMVALAYLVSRDGTAKPRPLADGRRLAVVGGAVVLVVFMQVVLGAQLRHHQGPVQAHVLGAVLVAGSVLWLLTVVLAGPDARPGLRGPALLLGTLLCVQLGLGLATNHALHGLGRDDDPVLLPTAHQSVGAVMLATAVVFWLRALRRAPAARTGGEAYA